MSGLGAHTEPGAPQSGPLGRAASIPAVEPIAVDPRIIAEHLLGGAVGVQYSLVSLGARIPARLTVLEAQAETPVSFGGCTRHPAEAHGAPGAERSDGQEPSTAGTTTSWREDMGN